MKSKLRRNRLISRSISIFVTMFIVVSLLVCCGNGQACTYITYTVCPGDTLWDLHSQYGQGVKYAKWEYEMLKANGKDYGAVWYAGEEIILLEAVR